MVCAGGLVYQARADSHPLTRAPDGRALTLTFADDFSTLRLRRGSEGVWRTTFGSSAEPTLDNRTIASNKELQIYADPGLADRKGQPLGLNPFVVHDGLLDIVADRASPAVAPEIAGHPFVSGLLTTQAAFSQTYGYFEARMKLPSGKGVWPAFWLLPADGSWPPEIDVMESIGDPAKVYATVHTKTMTTTGVEMHPGPGDFHTYAVAWDPKQIVFYIDGAETARSATPADMHKPMFVLLNLAVGGSWPGSPDADTPFPARLTIDYVRAYQFGR